MINFRAHRISIKLALRSWQLLADMASPFDEYTDRPTHTEEADMVGPYPDFTIPSIKAFRGDASDQAAAEVKQLVEGALQDGDRGLHLVCKELYATRQLNKTVASMYRELLDLKQQDYKVARCGIDLHSKMKTLMRDLMIYLGQEDLVITDAREAKLSQMLTTTFSAALKHKGAILSLEI